LNAINEKIYNLYMGKKEDASDTAVEGDKSIASNPVSEEVP
jgi:hypothetical protein